MIDLKKQYTEAKEIAKKLMRAGKIREYIKQLERLNNLHLQLQLAK